MDYAITLLVTVAVGLFVGYLTTWPAIKMYSGARRSRGGFGLFLARHHQVVAQIGKKISTSVLFARSLGERVPASFMSELQRPSEGQDASVLGTALPKVFTLGHSASDRPLFLAIVAGDEDRYLFETLFGLNDHTVSVPLGVRGEEGAASVAIRSQVWRTGAPLDLVLRPPAGVIISEDLVSRAVHADYAMCDVAAGLPLLILRRGAIPRGATSGRALSPSSAGIDRLLTFKEEAVATGSSVFQMWVDVEALAEMKNGVPLDESLNVASPEIHEAYRAKNWARVESFVGLRSLKAWLRSMARRSGAVASVDKEVYGHNLRSVVEGIREGSRSELRKWSGDSKLGFVEAFARPAIKRIQEGRLKSIKSQIVEAQEQGAKGGQDLPAVRDGSRRSS